MAIEWYGAAAVWAVLVAAFLFSRRRPSRGPAVPRWFALFLIGFVLGMGLSLVALQFVGQRLQSATRYDGTSKGVRNAWRRHYSIPDNPPSEVAD